MEAHKPETNKIEFNDSMTTEEMKKLYEKTRKEEEELSYASLGINPFRCISELIIFILFGIGILYVWTVELKNPIPRSLYNFFGLDDVVFDVRGNV